MCYVIQSKMGKCHLDTFKLTPYSINLVLVASSVLELLDLGRVTLGCPCHCFHGPCPPTILEIVSPGFSRRAHLLDPGEEGSGIWEALIPGEPGLASGAPWV